MDILFFLLLCLTLCLFFWIGVAVGIKKAEKESEEKDILPQYFIDGSRIPKEYRAIKMQELQEKMKTSPGRATIEISKEEWRQMKKGVRKWPR